MTTIYGCRTRSSPLDLFLALIYRDNITREADALQELLGSGDGS
jgi:hypothetical protein